MAILSIDVRTVNRASRSAIAAAAYRAGARIEDHRTGLVHDYRRRSGVLSSFIVAPAEASWAAERSALWNMVEAAERRKDARTAREFVLALPFELDAAARRDLAARFARHLVERYRIVADVAIHAPSAEGDRRNVHAHVLTTTRQADADGLGAKLRQLDMATTSAPEIEQLRQSWTDMVNQALREAGRHEAAVLDARPRVARGEPGEATIHLGPAATAMERRAKREARRAGRPYAAVTALGRTNEQIIAERRQRAAQARPRQGPAQTIRPAEAPLPRPAPPRPASVAPSVRPAAASAAPAMVRPPAAPPAPEWAPDMIPAASRPLVGSIMDMTVMALLRPETRAAIEPVLTVAWKQLSAQIAEPLAAWMRKFLPKRHEEPTKAVIRTMAAWRIPFKDLRSQFEAAGLLRPPGGRPGGRPGAPGRRDDGGPER